ncbi:hypothetical protein Cgig2_021056 [Carnegiea gigantea]|uniref:Uncharacterized protein n=1 Tax=Carnegiea gigantea TaxID=171969 RepID=A0A9Q1JQ07_9CARY|nr:hypothetical protein Cgig2_021056 [Carnegiea gigantea]
MLESSYNLLFGKLALKSLFEDYFDEMRHFSTRIMLKPLDNPNVDMTATVSGPFTHNREDKIMGNAQFRWQSDVDDPHTFVDLHVSNDHPVLRMRSCAYYPKYGFGAFGIIPLIAKKRISPEDYGVMGLRYGSKNISFGVSVAPYPSSNDFPRSAWLVGKLGRLNADGTKDDLKLKNLKNWSCAIGYGLGSTNPLRPSFNFGLEFASGSQFIASFYQHIVIQRKSLGYNLIRGYVNSQTTFIERVQNPFEEDEIVGVTNYLDFGFELITRLEDGKMLNTSQDPTFQVGASWQANKNLLLKVHGYVLLLFQHKLALPLYIFNNSIYERADPNFAMVTLNKEHVADNIHVKDQKRPLYQSDANSENFDNLPKELRPLGKLL